MTAAHRIDPGAAVGHVALRVSDLDASLRFYRDVLGLDVVNRLGPHAAFVSAGGYHHHIGLFAGAKPAARAPDGPGLIHVALRFPSRRALAEALRNILRSDVPITGAADHGDTESIYLTDPDGIDVELYVDRPPEQWGRRPGGQFDAKGLMAELDEAVTRPPHRVPA